MDKEFFLHEDISAECRDCGALSASVDGKTVNVHCDVEDVLMDVQRCAPAGNVADGVIGVLRSHIGQIRKQMERAGCPFRENIGQRMQYPCNPLHTAASEIRELETRIIDKRRERQARRLEA